MDSEQRRKRKRSLKPHHYLLRLFSPRTLVLCLSFFVFLLFLSSDRYLVSTATLRPVLSVPSLSLLSATASSSVLESLNGGLLSLRVEDRIQFPDHLLLLVSNRVHDEKKLDCVYHELVSDNSTEEIESQEESVLPAISVDEYNEVRSMVRCPLPPANHSSAVDLRHRGGAAVEGWSPRFGRAISWDKMAYEAVLDGDTALVFAKGLNLRPHRKSDPTYFSCHFGLGNWERDDGLVLTTEAVAAAQEVVRCLLPRSVQRNPSKAQGVRVTIGIPSNFHGGAGKSPVHVPLPSVAKLHSSDFRDREDKPKRKYELCACTMVWNQASSLREWITYHAWLGVERWFIYDNNSDDSIKEVIEELDSENYNVSRHSWPWIKTQEAGFSHCVLRARTECEWVGFFDVDEFFYFPFPSNRRQRVLGVPGENSLRAMVSNFSASSSHVGEIRTACHSFGPSGLVAHPLQGVAVGYTCRLRQPERHKSIVRLDALDTTLLNEVHHFKLDEGFRTLNVPENMAVINHFKYQVWETFRAKFYRRVATYVADWQENQNQGSRDRAPGLGTEPIEPPNWRLQFCEVWDTGLRDFVLANFADSATGKLPWERSRK